MLAPGLMDGFLHSASALDSTLPQNDAPKTWLMPKLLATIVARTGVLKNSMLGSRTVFSRSFGWWKSEFKG